jgi:two-component system NtrC family sensor kinase
MPSARASLPGGGRSAIGLLRFLLVASVVLPVALFVLAAWLNYRAAFAEAEQGVIRMSEVAHQHAAKVFDGQSQIVDRVSEIIRGLDAGAIRRSELPLHEAFARIVARLPQVQSVLLAGRDGHPLVSAGTYPVPADVDLAERDYFRAVVNGFDGTYVSSLQFGDVNKTMFFGLARPWIGPDGALAGVIDVAVLPGFFEDFYRVLVGEGGEGPQGKVITLVRDDGQVLVRYPPFDGPPPLVAKSAPFFDAVAVRPDAGVYQSRSVIDSGAPARVYAYQRIDGYPVYVVAGRSIDTIMAGWRRTMAGHLVFGVPATCALVLITWTAFVRARREERALAVARQEITRRELAEATLLRAQRLEAVGQMTGGIAHDFNNLLTVILGGAEMLGRRAEDPARVRRIAEQKLLAFSRRQYVKAETVDLNARLREFKELLDRAASGTIQVRLDLAEKLDPVRLDPGHFEAAILNLIGNARDAMPAGGEITIATRNVAVRDHAELPAGDYVRVAVADQGEGMDPMTATLAFEPFFTTKEVGKGTGLGLSQVYGFAKQAGGDVRIVTAPGAGTTVELLLPRGSGAPGMEPGPTDAAVARDGGSLMVLVVEDEPGVLAMAVESLHDLGHRTLTATNANAALAHLRSDAAIDVLFSDVVMPGAMTGVQLAQEAERLRPGLKVLLASGYAAGFVDEATQRYALLTKPYDRFRLAASLDALLRG